MSYTTTLAGYAQTVVGYETMLVQQKNRVTNLTSGRADVDAVVVSINKEMPTATEFTTIETRVVALEKNEDFASLKTTANHILSQVEALKKTLSILKTDLSVLESKI